jgi:type II secretory pathway pseudopilin PulG
MKLELYTRRRIALLARQDGFGIIEAVIAAFILILAAAATFTAYNASTRATFRAQQSQVRLGWAQQEMEKIRALPYDQIALTFRPYCRTGIDHCAPSDPLSASDPLSRLSGATFNLNRTGTGKYAALVYNTSSLTGGGFVNEGVINPGPEYFHSGDVSGYVYRFVVWQQNNGCRNTGNEPPCNGQDFKRVIIVVRPCAPAPVDLSGNAVSTCTPTASGGTRDYIELHSDFIDPADSAISDLPSCNGQTCTNITAQQLYLSDTPCNPTGTTLHQDIASHLTDNWDLSNPPDGHDLHNTLGICGDGLHIGSTTGAPDALIAAQPPGDPSLQIPRYDYESDLEPAWDSNPNPNHHSDNGIQLQPRSSSDCSYPAASKPWEKQHVWVSDKMGATGFTIKYNSDADKKRNGILTIYARTIVDPTRSTVGNPVRYVQPARICAYPFKRQAIASGGSCSASASRCITNSSGTPVAQDFNFPNCAGVPTGSSPGWSWSQCPGVFTYTLPCTNGTNCWPTTFRPIQIKLNMGEDQIVPANQRFGLLITVSDKNGTPVPGLEFMYDHPDTAAGLELETTTPCGSPSTSPTPPCFVG